MFNNPSNTITSNTAELGAVLHNNRVQRNGPMFLAH